MKLQEIETSEDMLRGLAAGGGATGWTGFVSLYRPAMLDYVQYFVRLHGTFGVDEELIVEEALSRLVEKLPDFRYDKEKGRFRDYLGRILKNMTVSAIRKNAVRTDGVRNAALPTEAAAPDYGEADEAVWRETIYVTILNRVLADNAIAKRTRDVFTRLVLKHEDAAVLAVEYKLDLNAVYQIKNRMTARLRIELERMLAASPFNHE